VQTYDADINEERSSNKSEGKDDAHALIMSEILAPQPTITSGKLRYI
jgi:hypothetical protein